MRRAIHFPGRVAARAILAARRPASRLQRGLPSPTPRIRTSLVPMSLNPTPSTAGYADEWNQVRSLAAGLTARFRPVA